MVSSSRPAWATQPNLRRLELDPWEKKDPMGRLSKGCKQQNHLLQVYIFKTHLQLFHNILKDVYRSVTI